MMNISLTEKFAVVCGSTQGIGLATAKTLAALGATCILLARNEEALKDIVQHQLETPNQQLHEYYVADFSDTTQVKRAIEQVVAKHDIHILINNSGGPKAGPIIDASTSEFTNAFNQHVVNNQLLAQAVVPGMKKLGYGRIVNIISTSVRTPLPNLGVSNTIRAAVASWSKTLANELGKFNITVNNVLPGFTSTQRLAGLIEANSKRRGLTEDEIEKEMIEGVPMKRFGDATEIAAVIAFLASPAASYVNGTSIPVDGGKTATV
jgi:3-oxoacyl-[acyl-carrier protein] reductase